MIFTYLMSPPSATTTLSDIGEWAIPIWNEFWPWGKLVLGFAIPLLIIGALIAFIRHYRN